MIPENYKTSLVVSQQLPSFIRNEKDYSTFISFLEAYYEFLESSGNIYDVSKNLLNYKDVDNTISTFEEYFFNEFLQYFPKESITSKRELVKFSKELYQRKSTPSSFKFLFRALFNADADTFNAKDYMLVASGGKWNITKYVKLNTLDSRFLNIKYFKIFGEFSKSVAKIENSSIVSNKIELYLSDIVRDFVSGEFVRVVDDNLKDVLFDGEILRAKIVGIIPRITINPSYRGSGYQVGDPALVIGGLNPESTDPKKATAEISRVGVAALKTISVLDGSNGYRSYPNTLITIASSTGSGANAVVGGLDANNSAIITFLPIDEIEPYANVYLDVISYGFSNTAANGMTRLADAFDMISIETFPISSVELLYEGSGFTSKPDIYANSYVSFSDEIFEIKNFGVLKPIKIRFPGFNYSNSDNIIISGGSGRWAFANVKSVDSNGSITRVQYIQNEDYLTTLGGQEYLRTDLPTLSLESANNKIIYLNVANTSFEDSNTIYLSSTDNVKVGMYVSGNGIPVSSTFDYFTSNTIVTRVESSYIEVSTNLTTDVEANDTIIVDGTSLLYVDGILGEGATFDSTSDVVGEIQEITVTFPGEDYISQPTVSLKVVDFAVINLDESLLPTEGQLVYQTDATTPTFRGFVESISVLPDELTRTFRLRIHSYSGTLNPNDYLYIDLTSTNSREIQIEIRSDYNDLGFVSGVLFYGDGSARANAEFISGTISGAGRYLNSDGFLSYSNYLESKIINEYTYFFVVEKEFTKYKNLLYSILHPVGKQVVPYNSFKTNDQISIGSATEVNKEIMLKQVTRNEVYGTLTSANTLQIYELRKDLTDISLSSVLSSNDSIHLESDNGEIFISSVSSIDDVNDIIYLSDSNILDFYNVAYGYANTVSNSIEITRFTGSYDIINNGNYSNTNPLYDIAFVGDLVEITNNSTSLINSIDYANNIIYANTELSYSGNVTSPSLVSITRNFSANNIWINYNLEHRYLLGYGNTVTDISIDGFTLLDENDNIIHIPLKF